MFLGLPFLPFSGSGLFLWMYTEVVFGGVEGGRLPSVCLVSTASCSLPVPSVSVSFGLSWCVFAL